MTTTMESNDTLSHLGSLKEDQDSLFEKLAGKIPIYKFPPDVAPSSLTDARVIVESIGQKQFQKKCNQMKDDNVRSHTASLLVTLAGLEGVSFSDAAKLLHTSPGKLREMVQFEITVPKAIFERVYTLYNILRYLHLVLEARATSQWLQTPITRFDNRTPADLIQKNEALKVLEHVKHYSEPVAFA